VTREEFYLQFKELLACLKENQDFSDLTPDTHLWAAGYLDSIGMLETIERIEEMLGRPLTLSGDFLPTFYTMSRIYEAHIAPQLKS